MNTHEEESILRRFQNNYPNFPIGKKTNPNNPDFISNSDVSIGIEITQVFKDQDSPTGSLVRAKEVFKRNVLANVVSLLSSSKFPKCILSIDFNDNIFTKKLNPRTVALKCYKSIITESKNIISQGNYKIENLGNLPDTIESYSLYINDSVDETDYIETAGAALPQLTNVYIQYILDKKEKAKKNYKFCNLYWLIIKEGSFEADSFSKIDIDKSQLKTTFDKVFIIRQAGSEIIELK